MARLRKRRMATQRIELPAGVFTAYWSERGLFRLLLPGAAALPETVPGGSVTPTWGEALAGSLDAYFSGRAVEFAAVPVDFEGYTPFQELVLKLAREIPYGRTATYGALAAEAGRPGAAQAVGQVLRRNRTPLVIPCHRVLARGGTGGFSAGLPWKERLLRLEGVSY
ncbi:MAG: MGMT family protein [Bacillota bacterium]